MTETGHQIAGGDSAPIETTDQVFDRVYAELRAIAGSYLRTERSDHTLQPTAVVHEAYLRLAKVSPGTWSDRRKFIAVASRAMRRILVDYARTKGAAKRQADTVVLDAGTMSPQETAVDLIALDRALRDLAGHDAQRARIVELHFFGGLSVVETADVLEIAERTVYRQMRSAKAWLSLQLRNDAYAS